MRESVIYQDIVQEGMEKGWEKGLFEGRDKGRKEEGLSLMRNILTSRWGRLPDDLLEKLNALSIERIEELSRVIFTMNNQNELADWLHKSAYYS